MTIQTQGNLTEQLEYSGEFAELILEQNNPSHLHEIDADNLLAQLDRMIAEAKSGNGKAE